MARSIIIIGPQGCGKTINAPGLCKAFGLTKWVDLDELNHLNNGQMPLEDHVILAIERPRNTHRLRCLTFGDAMKKVSRPHPLTPKQAA